MPCVAAAALRGSDRIDLNSFRRFIEQAVCTVLAYRVLQVVQNHERLIEEDLLALGSMNPMLQVLLLRRTR